MSRFEKVAYYARAYWVMHKKYTVAPYMPEYIGIEVTNVCNFRCAFCLQSNPSHHQAVPKTPLDEDRCQLFLEKVRAAGIKTNLIHWTLDGEPFMNMRFSRICELGVKFGFTNSHFASNGMLCTPERLLEFPINDCTFNVAIDFCADRNRFEEIRGTKNSWETIRRNIHGILAHERFHRVFVEVTDISSFHASDRKILADNFAALRRLFPKSRRIRFRTRTFHNATGFLEKQSAARRNAYHLCPYPWVMFRIASNGDVVACCRDLEHKTVLGNLLTQELPEIWNGQAMQALRSALAAKKPNLMAACRNCDLPYDDSKFSFKNILNAAKGRMQMFGR